MRRLLAGSALLGAMAAGGAAAEWRQIPVPEGNGGENGRVLIEANQLSYDEKTGTVTATGRVEINRGGRTLLADGVTYNERTGIVTADGNVSLTEPSGDVLFADHAALTTDLREGVIEQLRVLMKDRSRFAAVGGERTAGNRTVMYRGVYSPCELCPTDPDRAPLWQLKAERIIHDQTTHDVEYRDAWLEMFGVPVFYTPYFSHPDPTVERRSGFLAPTFGHDGDLGYIAQIPYYWTISPSEDLTFAPIFLSKEGVVGSGDYRRRFGKGRIDVEGSLGVIDRTRRDPDTDEETVKKDQLRGHIKANAGFDLDENWRTRLQIHRASDDTYLRKMDFDNAATLRSETLTEYFTGRSYGSIWGFASQELREDVDDDVTPVVLPSLSYSYRSRPQDWGFWTVDANALALYRDDGPESRRASLTGGWHLPLATAGGHLFDVSLSLRGDVYSADDTPVDGRTESGTAGRFVPAAVARWRYPLLRAGEDSSWLIEPTASVVVMPNKVNPRKIPNEDSQNFEFDDLNLLEANRFPGLDRVEGGQRVNYGVRTAYYGADGGLAQLFLGQSLSFSDPDAPEGSGLEDHLSDIVGRLLLSPADWLDLLYRFRFDAEDFDLNRSELGFRIGEPWLRLSGDYVQLDSGTETGDLFDRREQIRATVSSQFSRHWSAFASHWRDLEENESLRHQLGLRYADECLIFQVSYTKDFTSDREVEPSEKILFRLVFTNLGSFGIGQTFGGGSSERDEERQIR